MGSSKLACSFMLIGLIGLMISCSAVEQLDHDKPVQPLPRVIDKAMVDRIRNTNKLWYSVDKKLIELATE